MHTCTRCLSNASAHCNLGGNRKAMLTMNDIATNEELDELFRISEVLSSNKRPQLFGRVMDELIRKKWLFRFGNCISVTQDGRLQMQMAISGDYSK